MNKYFYSSVLDDANDYRYLQLFTVGIFSRKERGTQEIFLTIGFFNITKER